MVEFTVLLNISSSTEEYNVCRLAFERLIGVVVVPVGRMVTAVPAWLPDDGTSQGVRLADHWPGLVIPGRVCAMIEVVNPESGVTPMRVLKTGLNAT